MLEFLCAWHDEAQAVFVDECVVANQVSRCAGIVVLRRQLPHAKIVVRIGFVDKALAAGIDGNQARLGTIENDVWPHRHLAVGLFESGTRKPQHWMVFVIQFRPHFQAIAQAITCTQLRREGIVTRTHGEVLLSQSGIPCHATRGQHHAFARDDALATVDRVYNRTDDAPFFQQQLLQRRFIPNLGLVLLQAVQQASHQGIAHDQAGATLVFQAVFEIRQHHFKRGFDIAYRAYRPQ